MKIWQVTLCIDMSILIFAWRLLKPQQKLEELKMDTENLRCTRFHLFVQTASPETISINLLLLWYISIEYLFSSEFYLKVFGRLLGDSSSKIQLVDLAVLVPHRCFIVHNKLASLNCWMGIATASVRFDFSTF